MSWAVTRGETYIEPEALKARLGRWSASDQMLSAALADRLAELITAGIVPSGGLLPSRRRLAAVLGVSHNTVGVAYELLQDCGMLVCQVTERRPRVHT